MAQKTSKKVNRAATTDRFRYRYEVDGTAARVPRQLELVSGGRTASRSATRNRARATVLNPGYLLFLAVMVAATVFMCVRFVQLKETITVQNRENMNLRTELTTLRSENDAYYENVQNHIDWEHVRDVAINELGMHYATQDQVVWYNTDTSSYVQQYQAVP